MNVQDIVYVGFYFSYVSVSEIVGFYFSYVSISEIAG